MFPGTLNIVGTDMKSFFGLKGEVSYSNFSGFLKALNFPCSYLMVFILRQLIFNKIA